MNRNMQTGIGIFVTVPIFLCLYVATASAQAPAAARQPPGPGSPEPVLAATFDGQRITSADVIRMIAVMFRGRSYTPKDLPMMQAQALEQAINKRLVQRYVYRVTGGIDDALIDAALDAQQRELKRRGISLEEYLRKSGTTAAKNRKERAWELSWIEYVEETVTDVALQEYFKRHQREFDDTRVRVRHVLLRAKDRRDAKSLDAVKQKAADLRQRITSDESTFEDAARKYSAGPSRRHGGDLGFIPRHGQMVEPFSKAAFELEPGEISQPVVTSFGVHLIQCVEVRPGKKDWQDAKALLTRQVQTETFRKIAALQRDDLKVTYAEGFPHFKPGTGELAPRTSVPPPPDTKTPASEVRPPSLDP